MCARVSNELSGAQTDCLNKFLEPVLDNFAAQRWQHAAWTKFVLILLVCNGGTSAVTHLGSQEESVQDRLVCIVTEQHLGAGESSHADRLIDLHVLERLINWLTLQIKVTVAQAAPLGQTEDEVRALLNQLETLVDLFELQALTARGSVKERHFFELIEAISEFVVCVPPGQLHARFSECIDKLCLAYLEGVRSLNGLVDLFGDWVWRSSEQLVPPALAPQSSQTSKIERFLLTAHCFINSIEVFLELLKAEDQSSWAELVGVKLKPIKA